MEDVIVAAKNSESWEDAEFVCDGIDDHIEIRAAITMAEIRGVNVRLKAGTYNVAEMPRSDRVSVLGEGADGAKIRHTGK